MSNEWLGSKISELASNRAVEVGAGVAAACTAAYLLRGELPELFGAGLKSAEDCTEMGGARVIAAESVPVLAKGGSRVVATDDALIRASAESAGRLAGTGAEAGLSLHGKDVYLDTHLGGDLADGFAGSFPATEIHVMSRAAGRVTDLLEPEETNFLLSSGRPTQALTPVRITQKLSLEELNAVRSPRASALLDACRRDSASIGRVGGPDLAEGGDNRAGYSISNWPSGLAKILWGKPE